MNLSARKLLGAAGLLLSLFITSCEDPGKIGLNVDPKNGPILTKYKEFLLPSTEVQFDPRTTTNSSSFQAGSYSDPDFGVVTTKSFSWLGVRPTVPSLSQTAAYDSLTVSLRFTSVYGSPVLNDEIQSLELYQLAAPIDSGKTYTRTDDIPLGQQLGTINLYLQKNDTLQTDSTFVVRLNDAFGQSLFDKLKANDGTYDDDFSFNSYFNGIGLVPGASSTKVIQLSISTVSFKMYYHEINVAGETLSRTYTYSLGGMRFYQINSDLTGTPLDGIQINQDFTPSTDYRYVQSGTMIALKVDYSDFFDFAAADSNQSMVIQRAQVKLGAIEQNNVGSIEPTTLRGYFTDDTNIWPATTSYETSVDTLSIFVTLQDDGTPPGSYFNPQAIGLGAIDTTTYEGTMSTFLQNLYAGKFDSEDTPYERSGSLILFTPTASDFPQSSSSHAFTNHFKVHKDSIKLEVYYTVPNQ